MAQDMQWPSEDEDFDAVTTPEASRRRRSRSAPAESAPAPEPQAAPEPVEQPVERPAVAARTVTVTDEPAPQPVDPVEAAFAEDDEDEGIYFEEEEQPQQEPEVQEQPVAPVEQAPIVEEPIRRQKAPKQPKAPKPPKQPRDSSNLVSNLRTLFELVLVVALLGVGYYAYMIRQDKAELNSKVTTLSNNPQIAVQKQTNQLIANVGALMSLPQGEEPTIASVSDAAKAKQQSSFFANAQNGDKVLMYVKAGQAILYRPDTNKIVLVAPLTFNNSTAAATPAGTATTKTTR